MFKGLGTWLGLENPTYTKTPDDKENLSVEQEEKVVEAQNEVNKQQPADQDGEPEANQDNSENSKGLGDYIFSFATNATKKISDSMVETAQTIKKTVEEGKIDGIIDKTFLGDFQKEQEKFVQEKKAKKSEAAVPPWVGYNEEETIQQQILALSADKRNFLRDPPAGVQFHFDMEQIYPLAAVMLEEDQLLNRMRFDLVPKHVKEEVFWRNYFYRVSLIKQSAQLTALAAQQQQKDGEDRGASVSPEDVVLTGQTFSRALTTAEMLHRFTSPVSHINTGHCQLHNYTCNSRGWKISNMPLPTDCMLGMASTTMNMQTSSKS